jgi:hypothetical protein
MKQRTVTEQDLIRLASENAEAYSAGDWRRFKAPFAPDLVYHEMASQRRLQGADQLVQLPTVTALLTTSTTGFEFHILTQQDDAGRGEMRNLGGVRGEQRQ